MNTRTKYLRIILALALCLVTAVPVGARRLNDKVLNKPYADMRPWHLGFSVGTHTQNLLFTHNEFVAGENETWFVEQPSYAPGFCVNGLVDFRISSAFSLRLSPGMYFGNRDLRLLDTTNGTEERQNLKSTFLVAPVDIKYAGWRYYNSRPYVVAGVMPAFDLSKKQNDLIKLKSFDTYLTVGFGCDFYLPYFKFIPEVKFCFGLMDVIQHDRPDLQDDPTRLKFTQSLKKATSRMIVLTFYFE